MVYDYEYLMGEVYKLTEIGSNSGSEMLLGMLIALRICGYSLWAKEELQ